MYNWDEISMYITACRMSFDKDRDSKMIYRWIEVDGYLELLDNDFNIVIIPKMLFLS